MSSGRLLKELRHHCILLRTVQGRRLRNHVWRRERWLSKTARFLRHGRLDSHRLWTVHVEEGQAQESQSLALALVNAGDEVRPRPSDGRELVPAVGPSRVEQLLVQVLEENRALRLRLDQVETQSSWHSGGTRMSGVEQSLVSFGPGASGTVGEALGVHAPSY